MPRTAHSQLVRAPRYEPAPETVTIPMAELLEPIEFRLLVTEAPASTISTPLPAPPTISREEISQVVPVPVMVASPVEPVAIPKEPPEERTCMPSAIVSVPKPL